jgi:hypothetical protein
MSPRRPSRSPSVGTPHPVFDIALDVYLADRPQPLLVGRLGQRHHEIYFEYDASFLTTGLELSPLALPVGPGVRQDCER